jgi:hypothetical protein
MFQENVCGSQQRIFSQSAGDGERMEAIFCTETANKSGLMMASYDMRVGMCSPCLGAASGPLVTEPGCTVCNSVNDGGIGKRGRNAGACQFPQSMKCTSCIAVAPDAAWLVQVWRRVTQHFDQSERIGVPLGAGAA